MISLSQLDVVTHRGSYLHMENSLSAIEDAISMGFKWIEFDVRLTKDNVDIPIDISNKGYLFDIDHLTPLDVKITPDMKISSGMGVDVKFFK